MPLELGYALGERDIGTGPLITLNLDKLIGSHMAVLANSGGGKSWTLRKLLEITAGHIQQIVFDAEDEFYTLREVAPDLVLLGGDNGDAPVTTKTADQLPEMLLANNISAVLQINSLTISDQQAFVASFLTKMMELPRRLWRPVLVVIDEAHRFAPQADYPVSRLAVENLTSQGRKRGFTGVLATQRMAKISKDATDSVNNWLIGRAAPGPDQKFAGDVLGLNAKQRREMGALDDGVFYSFGPALTRMPARTKIGAVQTTHFRAGQSHEVPAPPAAAAMRQLLAGLAAAAKAATDEPANKESGAVVAAGQDLEQIREQAYDKGKLVGYQEGYATGLQQGYAGFLGDLRSLVKRTEALAYGADEETGEIPSTDKLFIDGTPEQLAELRSTVERVKSLPASRIMVVEPGEPPAPLLASVSSVTAEGTANLKITPALQRVIDALAWWKMMGFDQIDRTRACLIAGLSPKASTFGVYVGVLGKLGLMETPAPGMVALTAAGWAAAKPPEIGNTMNALRTAARALLSPAEARVWDALKTAYPEPVLRKALAEEVGLSPISSTLGVYLGKISSYGFLGDAPTGKVVLASWLFERRPK